jgi:hypothetical protein
MAIEDKKSAYLVLIKNVHKAVLNLMELMVMNIVLYATSKHYQLLLALEVNVAIFSM